MEWKDFLLNNEDKLTTYVQTIARVHGKKHPELIVVRDYFIAVLENIDDSEKVGEYLEQIRLESKNFTVPADGCETYQAAYHDLKESYQLYKQ
ncbi:hypothetical protein [Facklamia sp. 7083-14-GEN3]|uniref:hypothetical protein n=1 Tax=Facklamia sp. 7083-14-GEN3 TaxID=2973478 RepID=UPI00215BF5E9|nr:hypothetical protein [Facklamia sp. 7083-14-GEN3]MCR8968897.1 hypothetical protein [Facklamia sp. 7083-14-GEN3]